MFNITVKCYNNDTPTDWTHTFSVYPNTGTDASEDLDVDFLDEFNLDVDFDCSELEEVWIVYYYYENSVADVRVFQEYSDAVAHYKEISHDHAFELYNEDDVHVEEKNKKGEMCSTIYNKGCDGFSFPDKGSRYGLVQHTMGV